MIESYLILLSQFLGKSTSLLLATKIRICSTPFFFLKYFPFLFMSSGDVLGPPDGGSAGEETASSLSSSLEGSSSSLTDTSSDSDLESSSDTTEAKKDESTFEDGPSGNVKGSLAAGSPLKLPPRLIPVCSCCYPYESPLLAVFASSSQRGVPFTASSHNRENAENCICFFSQSPLPPPQYAPKNHHLLLPAMRENAHHSELWLKLLSQPVECCSFVSSLIWLTRNWLLGTLPERRSILAVQVPRGDALYFHVGHATPTAICACNPRDVDGRENGIILAVATTTHGILLLRFSPARAKDAMSTLARGSVLDLPAEQLVFQPHSSLAFPSDLLYYPCLTIAAYTPLQGMESIGDSARLCHYHMAASSYASPRLLIWDVLNPRCAPTISMLPDTEVCGTFALAATGPTQFVYGRTSGGVHCRADSFNSKTLAFDTHSPVLFVCAVDSREVAAMTNKKHKEPAGKKRLKCPVFVAAALLDGRICVYRDRKSVATLQGVASPDAPFSSMSSCWWNDHWVLCVTYGRECNFLTVSFV